MRSREVMTCFDAKPIDTFQSNFWIPKYKLLLSLYVDDVVVSGPSSQHKLFWDEMQRHLELDEPAESSAESIAFQEARKEQLVPSK